MKDKPSYAGPPWTTRALWAEANASMLRLSGGAGLARARALAGELAARFQALDPAMERLCAATCPRCVEPCCVRARVWLDFSDLLFMHLSGQVLPLAQLRAGPGEACRYLGAKGCVLPRASRPWICTWYLCPEQKARMRQWSQEERAEVEQGLERVRALRAELVNTAAGDRSGLRG